MSTPLTAVGSGLQRTARHSEEYVAKAQNWMERTGGRRLSAREKQERLATMLSDRQNGMLRLGQSMIGPIQLKLRYQGILRNVLLEDTLTPGVPVEYDVLDDLGQAYFLHGDEGEVKITPFEGKRVRVELFRIASFPKIKKEDLYWLRSNLVEYTQDETKQAIMRAEDSRLICKRQTKTGSHRLSSTVSWTPPRTRRPVPCRTRSRSPQRPCSPPTSTPPSRSPTSACWTRPVC